MNNEEIRQMLVEYDYRSKNIVKLDEAVKQLRDLTFLNPHKKTFIKFDNVLAHKVDSIIMEIEEIECEQATIISKLFEKITENNRKAKQ